MAMYRCSIHENSNVNWELQNCIGVYKTHRYSPILKLRQRQRIFVQLLTATWSFYKHRHDRTDILQKIAVGCFCSLWDFAENLGEFLSRFHSKRLWTKNNKGSETKKVQKKLCWWRDFRDFMIVKSFLCKPTYLEGLKGSAVYDPGNWIT